MTDEGLKGTGSLMTLAVPSHSVSGNGKMMQGCQVPALLGSLPSFKPSGDLPMFPLVFNLQV